MLLEAGSDRNCAVPYKPHLSPCLLLPGLFQAGTRGPWRRPVGAGSCRRRVQQGSAIPAAGQGLEEPCRRWPGGSALRCQLWKVHLRRMLATTINWSRWCSPPGWSGGTPGAAQTSSERQPLLRATYEQRQRKEKAGTGGENYLLWACGVYLIYVLTVLNRCRQRCIRGQSLCWHLNDQVRKIWLQWSKLITNDLIMVFHFAVSQGLIKFHPKQRYCLTSECIEAGKQQFYFLYYIVIIVC